MALGAFVGTAQGLFHVAGGRLDSFYKEEDEFERREIVRRTTRVPVELTVAEIGEGRGTLYALSEVLYTTYYGMGRQAA